VVGARLRGATTLTGVLTAVAVLVVCRAYLEIRPADLTNLFVVVLAVILAAATRRDRRFFWALAPFLALWCNLHSGFVFAFIVMVILVVVQLLLKGTPGPFERMDNAAIGTAVLATALCFLLYTWAQRHTSANRAALIFALEPVFAGLVAWWIAGEQWTGRSLAGAGLILAGIVLSEVQPARREKHLEI